MYFAQRMNTKVCVKILDRVCKNALPFLKFLSDWYNFFRVQSWNYVEHFQGIFVEKKWNYHRENEEEKIATLKYLIFCAEKNTLL